MNNQQIPNGFGGFMGASSAYVAFLFASIFLTQRIVTQSPVRYIIAILPVIPLLFSLRYIVQMAKSEDELKHRINSEALTISFVLTMIVTFTYGMLETVGFPSIPLFFIGPMMIAIWGITQGVVSRKYQ